MMRKKLFQTLLAALLGFVMIFAAACGEPAEESSLPGESSDPPAPTVTIDEAVSTLSADPYTADLAGDFGLSDPSNVGVIEAETQAARYPAPADSEFPAGNVLDFESYAGSDTQKLNAVLAEAASKTGAVKIKLPDRVLEIDPAQSATAAGGYAVSLANFKDLTVEGGAQTVFEIQIGSAWVGGISVSNCENLHLQGVRVDYSVSPSVSGVLASYDAAALSVTYDIPVSFRETLKAYEASDSLGTLYSFVEYDKYTLAPKENGNILIQSQNYFADVEITPSDAADTAGTVKVTFAEAYRNSFRVPRSEELVALGFSMYGYNGMTFSACKDVYLEDCAVYACPGMGLTAGACENLFINRLMMTLKGDRLMTATADGLHLNACTGEVSITNSVIENTHDDALNIKQGYWYNVSSVDSVARTMVITRRTESISAPKEGAVLEVYDPESFAYKGSFTVKSATGTGSSFTVAVEERISGSMDLAGGVITDVSDTARLTFSNNIVRNKRNRGILVQTRNSVITNNTFDSVGHGAVSIHSSLDVFNEATMPRDIRIANNKFINNGYLLGEGLRGSVSVFAIGSAAEVAPIGTITGIEVSNNYFAESGNAGISFRGVGGSDTVIADNLFYNVARVASSEMTECAVELINSGNFAIRGNYNYNTLGSETFSGIVTGGLTDPEIITLEDNYNLRYQEVSGEVTVTEVRKIDPAAVTLDGDLGEWADMGTSIEMVGSSLATGEEIAFSAFEDVFGVEVCKLAWSDEGIYFVFRVRDDKLDFKTQLDFWTGDCVELFLSDVLTKPNADFQLFKETGNVLHAAFTPTWGMTVVESRTNSAILEKASSMQCVVKQTADGYAGELFLPFSAFDGLKESLTSGGTAAMAFIFGDNDRDELSRKRVQVGNVPHFVENYKTKTAKMPQYTLVD